jgi:hypothetical protein
MEELYNYVFNPQTLVSLIMFVFWLGVAWSNLNWRLRDLERRIQKIEEADLDTKLREIKVDLDWIKKELQKLSK